VICDDEAELLSELAEWFEAQGWNVLTASTANEALELLMRGGRTTCLITDRLMPLFGGDVLVQRIGALPAWARPELVAVMTGDPSMEDGPWPSGVDVVFMKPVDPGEALAAIAKRLRARPGRVPRAVTTIPFAATGTR